MEPRDACKPWKQVPPPPELSSSGFLTHSPLNQRLCGSQLKLAGVLGTVPSRPCHIYSLSCILVRPLTKKLM